MTFTREQLIYIGLIGVGIGLVLGLVPFILGIRRGNTKLGVLGLILSAVLGGLGFVYYGGVFPPIVSAALFAWLASKKPAA